MPTRSSNSSVLEWPDRETVDRAVRAWARRHAEAREDVRRIGYLGSYARGDWGPGSDLDLVIVLRRSALSFVERGLEWDASDLPVPADVLVYTESEVARMREEGRRFAEVVKNEVVWVWEAARPDGT